MKAALGLGLLAVAGVGLVLASKSAKAAPPFEPTEDKFVVGDSGQPYSTSIVDAHDDAQGHIIDVQVKTRDGALILQYEQYQGDDSTRIWVKDAGGMATSDPLFISAVKDFGVFTSVG